jgi:hypothetical protein
MPRHELHRHPHPRVDVLPQRDCGVSGFVVGDVVGYTFEPSFRPVRVVDGADGEGD